MTLLPGQFVDDHLRTHVSDLLFSVEVDGETVLLYLLFEHKSWVDPYVRLQPDVIGLLRSLFEYLARASKHVTPSTFWAWADREGDRLNNDTTRKELMTLAERFMEEGRQEGWQKGSEEGWQKGRQEGRQEGHQEGRQQELIEAVKLGLELRFGGEGMAFAAKVEHCSDLSVLAQAREAIRKGRGLEEIKGLFV